MITFTLTGFRTVRREGIELSGSFVATVNEDLQVGAVAETITVTGEAPVVDVQSAQTQRVISNDVLASIPANRSFEHLAALVPGIQLSTTAQNVGGINGPTPPFFGGHGGATTEGRLNVDGISTGGATGGVSLLIVDTGNSAEITISTTGGLADAEIGGPVINVVPRTGGNALSGQFFFAGAGPAHAERQLHAGIEGRGPAVALGVEEGVGRQPRGGWPDQARQVVVLCHHPDSGELRLAFPTPTSTRTPAIPMPGPTCRT